MSAAPSHGSSTLLLQRLLRCPTDAAAWDQFVRRYSGTIYHWCRRYRLQDADAQDVTQMVLVKLHASVHRPPGSSPAQSSRKTENPRRMASEPLAFLGTSGEYWAATVPELSPSTR